MKKIAELYKALGDETRLKIIDMLTEREMCVCEIIDRLKMSQPAVSHHLKILKQADLLKDTRDGRWIYYSLNENVFKNVFAEETSEVVQSFAAPIMNKLQNLKPSGVRTDPAICEALIKKQK